jgi:hypothetical protein
MKMATFPALCTSRLYPQEIFGCSRGKIFFSTPKCLDGIMTQPIFDAM